MKNNNVLHMLSIAKKAGKVASGEFMTENAVKSGGAALVIVAEDASDNTKKKFKNMCEYYKIPVRIHGIKDELGHCIGKEFRASLAITDEGLAQAVMKKMD
ncbi:MAG: ribosomal L7Ae/L30e/S12e/Gadd45 family protein [Lachnospiraceae bacterium]|nr:50S ribosomal protein L7ae [Lachnospiraceae bacterium]